MELVAFSSDGIPTKLRGCCASTYGVLLSVEVCWMGELNLEIGACIGTRRYSQFCGWKHVITVFRNVADCRSPCHRKLQEIVDDLKFLVDENHVDVVIWPPDPDYLTDENETNDDELGIAEIRNVPGPLEVECSNIDYFPGESYVTNVKTIEELTKTTNLTTENEAYTWKTFLEKDYVHL